MEQDRFFSYETAANAFMDEDIEIASFSDKHANDPPSRRSWFSDILKVAHDALTETLWPTRCAICDLPGMLICPDCLRKLQFVDSNKACPRCGGPHGIIQCTECNRMLLEQSGIEAFPLDGMRSALCLDASAKRIITVFKDQDEHRLADFITTAMANYIPPEWTGSAAALTFIPDTERAFRRRGFDHAELLAQELARKSNVSFARLFSRPRTIDQRILGKRDRLRNMRTALHLLTGAPLPQRVIIADDVCTTGATIYAAALALRDAGVQEVYGITFGKVVG